MVYYLLIVFFAYFYVSITFDPTEVADNMKKYGGFIPGIRAGKPTAQYLDYVLTRLTLPGSIYLAVIAIIPFIAFGGLGLGQSFLFGGTSLPSSWLVSDSTPSADRISVAATQLRRLPQEI